MTIDYQLNQDDLRAFSRETRHFASTRASRLYWFLLFPAFIALLAIFTGSFGIAALLGTGQFIVVKAINRWSRRLALEAYYSPANIRLQTLPQKLTLTPECITVRNEAAELAYHWPYITRLTKGPQYITLFLTPIQKLHIPLRAFQNNEQIAKFVSELRLYAPHAASDRV